MIAKNLIVFAGASVLLMSCGNCIDSAPHNPKPNRSEMPPKNWMRDNAVQLKNTPLAYEQEVVDAITNIIIPPPETENVDDNIVLWTFSNNDPKSGYAFELKNKTTDQILKVIPNANERRMGQWKRANTFEGFEGDSISFEIDYSKLKHEGVLLTSSVDKRPVPEPHIKIEGPVVNYLNGKKIVWLGTSISENSLGELQLRGSYPSLICRRLGAKLANNSRAGLATSFDPDGTIQKYGSVTAYLSEYADPKLNNENTYYTKERDRFRSFENALLGQNGDLYVFDLNANNEVFTLKEISKFDFVQWQYKDGSSFEQNRLTYLGGLLFLLNKLKKDNPKAKIVFVSEFAPDHGSVLNIEVLTSKFGYPHFNEWDIVTGTQKSLFLNVDNIHPTQAGQRALADKLIPHFQQLNF